MIKVLVVDDSALMRKLITGILSESTDIKVIGTARDGIDALEKIASMKPDVVTLDVEMPRMDGISTLKEIKSKFSETQVIMISSLTTAHAKITLKALEIGAFDFIAKPSGKSIDISIESVNNAIIDKIHAAYGGKGKKYKAYVQKKTDLNKKKEFAYEISKNQSLEKLIAIGISTGGPNSILHVLPRLPHDLNACILMVQHMPPGFTKSFADRLNKICNLTVTEAKTGDVCSNGKVYIAPGGKHLSIKRSGTNLITVIEDTPPVNRHKPSCDVLFESVAKNFGFKSLGIIMTGMGQDGAEKIGLIKKCGGKTIGQDEKTSIVYGMPKVAKEMGNLDKIVELDKIYKEIIEFSKF